MTSLILATTLKILTTLKNSVTSTRAKIVDMPQELVNIIKFQFGKYEQGNSYSTPAIKLSSSGSILIMAPQDKGRLERN